MKSYRLKQEFGVYEEDGTPKKEFEVNITLKENGINKNRVMGMLGIISGQYARILSQECEIFDTRKDMERMFANADNETEFGKGWGYNGGI